jgi:hypothetical protein
MVVGGITMLLIVLQFFLAGVGVFGASDYDMHRSVGYLIAVLAALLFVLALVGSLDRRRVLFSGLLLLLMIVQIALIESDEPWVMAFHPLNGLLILGAGSEMMRHGRKAMREARVGAPAGMRAAEGD